MNPNLQRLQAYPFEKLAALKAQAKAPSGEKPHIALSIGEPKHAAPQFVLDALCNNLNQIGVYPATKGTPALREAIATWLQQRFNLPTKLVDPETQILPVNGTREALFAFAQAVVDSSKDPLVVSPNPFYQIYEGAAFLSGADLHFLNCTAANNYLPDLATVAVEIWQRCQLLYLCSPGNPSGAVVPLAQLQQLLELADRYDFVIASDECYSELYFDEGKPPIGLLEACAKLGRDDFARCVVFHSLSKRSNLPGLRSGFVAGDKKIIQQFLLYRTYHGCAMSQPIQIASTLAWQDEQHVIENRALYKRKFDEVINILGKVTELRQPEGGFYLWLQTPLSDLEFTRALYSAQNVTVLPGSFIARPTPEGNPGANHVRIALVATAEECVDAAGRLAEFIKSL